MVSDDVREQRQKLKDAPFTEKFSYYAYYYWKHVLLIVIVVIACISLGHDIYENNKEKSFYVVFTDTVNTSAEEPNVVSDYIISREIDTNKNPYLFDNGMMTDMDENTTDQTTLAYVQKLRMLFDSDDIDLLIGTQGTVDDIASMGALANLEEILPPDLLAVYQDDFYYYDYGKDGKVAVGIYMEDVSAVSDYYAEDARPILSISLTAPHLENTLDFLSFIQTYRSVTPAVQ